MKWLLILMVFDAGSLRRHEHVGENVLQISMAFNSEETCWAEEKKLTDGPRFNDLYVIASCVPETEYKK